MYCNLKSPSPDLSMVSGMWNWSAAMDMSSWWPGIMPSLRVLSRWCHSAHCLSYFSSLNYRLGRLHTITYFVQAMLSGPGQFAENETNEVGHHHRLGGIFCDNSSCFLSQVNFREIPSHVLQKVCMYFTYKTRWVCAFQRQTKHDSQRCIRYTNSSTEIPEFPIPPEIALELLMAANFLDC